MSSKWLVCLYRHTTTPPHQARTRACLTKACLTKARLTTLLPYYRTAQGLDLGQLGDDDTRKLSIASMRAALSIPPLPLPAHSTPVDTPPSFPTPWASPAWYRSVETCGDLWRSVEICGDLWRSVENSAQMHRWMD